MTQTKSRTQDCSLLLQHGELLNPFQNPTPAQVSVIHYNYTLALNKSLPADDQQYQVCVPLGQGSYDEYAVHLKLELGSQIEICIHLFGKADLARLVTCQATCLEFGITVTNEEVQP